MNERTQGPTTQLSNQIRASMKWVDFQGKGMTQRTREATQSNCQEEREKLANCTFKV